MIIRGDKMQSLIEEMYYGNISPMDRSVVKGGRYAHLTALIRRHEDELLASFSGEQKEAWEKYDDCISELESINEVEIFRLGFKIGFRLCSEAMCDVEEILEPKME